MRTLKEIKTILSKKKASLKKRYLLSEISIFGSYARGEQKKGSDLDILVEFDEIPDLFQYIKLENELEDLLGVKVDLVRKKSIREELKASILKETAEI